MEKPSASSASSKVRLATGNFSARSRPMPAYCEFCPGKRNTRLVISIGRLTGARWSAGTTTGAAMECKTSINFLQGSRVYNAEARGALHRLRTPQAALHESPGGSWVRRGFSFLSTPYLSGGGSEVGRWPHAIAGDRR